MPANAGIKVEGARELRASLRRAGEDLSDLKAAHAAASGVVVAASRIRAPHRSGRLAGSVRGSGTATKALIRAGGVSVPYANPIHWGWKARGIAAQPFITDAAQNTEPVWTVLYERQVELIVNRIRGA